MPPASSRPPDLLSPAPRVQVLREGPVKRDGRYVLYWMTSARRLQWNPSLDRAVAWAKELGRPLVVLEALRAGYPWASERLHGFVLDGMREHRAAKGVTYLPYVEPAPGEGRGLLAALATDACVTVTDQFPAFFLPRMLAAAVHQVPVRLEAVDGNGLIPLTLPGRSFLTAFAFRRWVQSHLEEFIHDRPTARPLARLALPGPPKLRPEITRRWLTPALPFLEGGLLPIDHSVPRASLPGGTAAARKQLDTFLHQQLEAYAEDRNHPDLQATSGLSPYLHFGHLSAHEVFWRLMEQEGWSPDQVQPRSGKREGFWKVSASAEAFLDQLVVWRELGFNFCHHREDYADYTSLPAWAQRTLEKHAGDPRPDLYPLEVLEKAQTADPLWNAAQRQLVREGVMHNYLRMLWGKRVLEWSATPQQALERLLHLNNKYALDGRDPNSYSGIFWVFGRFDRPWGPERPIFGTVRYMSSANTARKLRLRRYLETYG